MISILLPSLVKARESAMRVKCGSNLRQIAMAWYNYAGDNKGAFPPHLATAPIYITHFTGSDMKLTVFKYVKEPRIFYCPTTAVSPDDPGMWNWPSSNGNVLTDYQIMVGWKKVSGGVNIVNYVGPGAALVERMKTVKPKWVMASDQAWTSTTNTGSITPEWVNHPYFKGAPMLKLKSWKGLNVLFYDSHVEWRLSSDVVEQANSSSNVIKIYF